MEDVKDLFKGEELAVLYKAERPALTPLAVQKVIDFLAEKFNPSECDAIDVGCGSGQATLPLAPFLRHIVGLDPSEAQLSQIRTDSNVPANVEFRVGAAEDLPFEDSSLQLVNVKTALHWFDIPKFFEEVDRILQPGGVLAVSCGAGIADINGHEEEILAVMHELAKGYRTPEWDKRITLTLNQFRDINFPYEECIRHEVIHKEDKILTVRSFSNALKSRSDVAEFFRVNPEEAEKDVKDFEDKVMKILGATGLPEETTVEPKTKEIVILCRKPMEDVKDLFKREEHAFLYKAYRPNLCSQTIKKIVDFLAEKFNPSECDAVDVGCGSGQATLPLAPFLRHVVGLDPSEAQLSQIRTDSNVPTNVEFRVGEAENLPFEDSSLQLVNVKTALHWFDIPKFFEEVDRVLQPRGVLAVSFGAGFNDISGHEEEIYALARSIGKEYRTSEWERRTKLSINQFRDVKFPYEECVRYEDSYKEGNLSVRTYSNGLRTRADMAEFFCVNPDEAEKAIKDFEEKMMKILGATGLPEETNLEARLKHILILCRKPQVVVS